MRKIAIFGGTFDPFTEAHKAIVKQLFDYVGADEVIVSPTVTNWYRDKDDVWLTDMQRVNVIYRAIDSLTAASKTPLDISINMYDLKLKASFDSKEDKDELVKSWHYYDTLRNIRANYGYSRLYDDSAERNEFYTVIGSDQLEFFKNWHRWEDILKMSKLIVVNNRNGKHVESDIPHIDIEIDKKFWSMSATEIRTKYKCMKSGYDKYLKSFDPPETDVVLAHTPIFDLTQRPAPYEDKPDFKPVAVKSNDWVTVIAESNGKFCCVKQLRYGLMEECEEFIAGIVDDSEVPLYAARRELCEEVGIELSKGVSELKYLGKFAANPAFMTNFMHYFYVNLDTAEYVQTSQKLDANEKLTVVWKDKKEILKHWLDGTSVFMGGALMKLIEYGIVNCNELPKEDNA